MNTKLPYIASAFICEKMLQEKDGVLSAIRIIDKLFIRSVFANKPGGKSTDDAPSFAPPMGENIIFLIGLKGGSYHGPAKVRLVAHSPNGSVISGFKAELDIELKGEENGANVIINVNVDHFAKEGGVYWIDVLFNNHQLTRMPLAVFVDSPPSVQKTAAKTPARRRSPRKA